MPKPKQSGLMRYQMIDNFVYLYHTNEVIIIPAYAESITDNIQANFNSEIPLSRSAPIYSYKNSGPRSLQVAFNLQRDIMFEINYQVSTVKPDAGDDYVDYMIKAIQASALPEYDMALKMVNPPVIALKLGTDIFIKGVITGPVGVTYSLPIIPGVDEYGNRDDSKSRYSSIQIAFGVEEVDPFQASDVMRDGSFRGVPKTLEKYIYGDIVTTVTKNQGSTYGAGKINTQMVK